ncbi:MAG: hypothetical protein ACKO04_02020 [Actinomycetes bacterium]
MTRPRTARPAVTTAVLVLAIVTAACSGGGRSSTTTTAGTATPTNGTATTARPSTSAPTTATPTTAAPTTARPPTTVPTTSTTTGPVTTGSTAGPAFLPADAEARAAFPGSNVPAVLVAVRVGRNDGYDRVVFEFRPGDALPGYLVGYVPLPVSADPSDLPIELSGDHALVVRMQAASRFDFERDATLVYPGPNRLAGTGVAISEVVLRGDFEALLSWVVGLRGARPFRVSTLGSPPRVVVDVAPR